MRLWSALVLAAGVALCGFFAGEGFFKGRASDRFVTVKGVSERDVVADVALWPISFVSTGDELQDAQAKIRSAYEQTLEFLHRHGITSDQAEVQSLEVTDVFANPYRSGPAQSRFIIEQTVMVRTGDPGLIERASRAGGISEESQMNKTVRVVSTIEYYLKD